jgi:hypothetical protein
MTENLRSQSAEARCQNACAALRVTTREALSPETQPGIAHWGLTSVVDLVVVTGVASGFPGVVKIALCHGLAEK